jgi:hypothetical protein
MDEIKSKYLDMKNGYTWTTEIKFIQSSLNINYTN